MAVIAARAVVRVAITAIDPSQKLYITHTPLVKAYSGEIRISKALVSLYSDLSLTPTSVISAPSSVITLIMLVQG